MEKKWYVVHTYSGYENKVKAALEERIKLKSKEEFFSEIVVPAENVVEMIRGEKKTTTRKFFPGYVLINMVSLIKSRKGNLNRNQKFLLKKGIA